MPPLRIRADDGLYQKPELSFFDTAQKFAHVLGTGSLLQAYPLDNESAEIPLAKATLQKDEVEDVYLTPEGSTSNFGVLELDSPEVLMDLPLSFDNRDIEDQEWLYSLHDTSMFDITGDMQNIDHSNDVLSLPTEIRTDTSWSKEIGGFLDIPITDPISMEFSLAAFSGSDFKMADDQQFFNEIFSTGQSFEDIIGGCGLVVQPIQSEQAGMQDLWLPDPIATIPKNTDNLSISKECKPSVPTVELNTPAPVTPSVDHSSVPSPSSPSVDVILNTPVDTPSFTPELHTPQPKASKPKGSMLLFGKHENEIISKLKGVKKMEKRSLKNRLVAMPVEEFNSLLEQSHLSEIEVAFMKEWRRRGKNKTAAQLARKRRREDLSGLDTEVDQLKRQTKEMLERCEQLKATVTTYRNKTLQLESELFKRHTGIHRDLFTLHSQKDALFTQRTESYAVPLHAQS